MEDQAKLSEEVKELIVRAAETYKLRYANESSPEGLSDAKLSDHSKVNKTYLSYMMNRKWNKMKVKDKVVKISDKEFKKLARAIGYQYEGAEVMYWKHFDTENYLECYLTFEDARADKIPYGIDDETGYGKSYSASRYKLENVNETYWIECSSDMSFKDFFVAMATEIGVSSVGTAYQIRCRVSDFLRNRHNPLLIIDEAENLRKQPKIWGSIKAIMDNLNGYCGIVVIGSNNFEDMLQEKALADITPFPQVLSRLRRGGIKKLLRYGMDDVNLVCDEFRIPIKVRPIIYSRTSNMRELNGIVNTLLKKKNELNEPLTIENVNKYLDS